MANTDYFLNMLSQSGTESKAAGGATFATGMAAEGAPLKYYQDLLSGDRSRMESAIAPEKSEILAQYRARRRQLARGQRGGGTNEAVAESGFAQSGDIAGLLAKLRPEAAKGSAEIAGQMAGMGLQQQQIGSNELMAALSATVQERGQTFGLIESLF